MTPRMAPPSERTLGAVEYLLGALELAVIVLALGYAAVRLRRSLLPGWSGPPALVGELVAGLTLAILLAEALGTFDAFGDWEYVVASVALALLAATLLPRLERRAGPAARAALPAPPYPRYAVWVVGVICAVIVATWAIPTLTALAGGMSRADSLWYHMPFSARFVQTGSTGGLNFVDPIFFAHFYPQNSEVLHSIPILAFARDFASPLLNLGFLGLGLLAGWAIGRPYGLAPHALLGAAVVLGAETMTEFQAGESLNDIVGVSLLLCAVALLVNGFAPGDRDRDAEASARRPSPAWAALGLAGAAAGLAAGTKLSFLAPVALLTAAVVAIAPRGGRSRAGAAWTVPMLAAGGYWYARNLLAMGNPIPFTSFGPLGLPSPERGFELRPGYAISHYFGDPDIWRDWFVKYFAEELGPLWFVVLAAVLGGGAYALWRGREPVLRALGAVALLTAIAYVFTPLTAGGEEGEPIAFEWNVRYLAPAVAIGLAMLPLLPQLRATPRRRLVTFWALAIAVALTTLTTVQWSEGGHKKGALATAVLVLALFAAAGIARRRGWIGPAATRRSTLAVAAIVLAGSAAAGYAVERHYLERRYENLSPQLHIAEAARWARDLRDARIAISGVRGVFNQFAFYGTDLSNHVQWLGLRGPDDAFRRIPDCETWRAAVNRGGYTHVVTMYDPYDPARGDLTDTKEALWTRADPHAREILRDGPVSVFQIVAPLDSDGCGSLPDLSPAELDGDSVNLEPDANQPPPEPTRRARPPSAADSAS